jgi:L-Lysine epsilon oxidase N-terminal/L-lysine epsilon oxidase C-terminal domain
MSNAITYRIHPGVGIARLGDSPNEFCITPEGPAQLPLQCDELGNTIKNDGRIKTFKDAEGQIKRTAARFQIFVYDEESPEGRPLKIGDHIEGGGNRGTLVDIIWRVQLANKKAAWYEFDSLRGETGYPAGTPLRNADITDPTARQKLVIDPGPQIVDCTENRKAEFSRGGNPSYAVNFPPEDIKPNRIDTLGSILTDNDGRLLVLGGHGNSGSFKAGFGHPRIDSYANSDGWFDDVSDGPVMARLVMKEERVDRLRYVDVEYPAWVLVGYPRYAPQVLDMITLEDVIEDMSIRDFAYRTDMFGKRGTFKDPPKIDPLDAESLQHWKAGPLQWNREYRPWFWRDIWSILFRADEFSYFSNILVSSNEPHNQSSRGTFDPLVLSIPPKIAPRILKRKLAVALSEHASGEQVEAAIEPALMLLDATRAPGSINEVAAVSDLLASAARDFIRAVLPADNVDDPLAYSAEWKRIARENVTAPSQEYVAAREALEAKVQQAIDLLVEKQPETPEERLLKANFASRAEPVDPIDTPDPKEPIDQVLHRVSFEFVSGALLRKAIESAREQATTDPNRAARMFLYNLMRKPGEENQFRLNGNPATRDYNLPLMPLLAGDNPISNQTVDKFLRLTDTQLFLLRQWAEGKFIDEVAEGFAERIDPWRPYEKWQNKTGRDLDRGVLMNALGGAFCPGGEVAWIIRNPAIWREPYRIKADPNWSNFQLTAAQQNTRSVNAKAYIAYADEPLSLGSDFDLGLQPGDLTKLSGLPWQADFNECSTQSIDITYEEWNTLAPESVNDTLMQREQQVWETLWWPVHRPMQVSFPTDKSGSLQVRAWARGIPQTYAGDLKMVTEWSKLGFVIRNPFVPPKDLDGPSPSDKYVCVEDSEVEL